MMMRWLVYVVKAYFTPIWSIRQRQRAHPGLSNFESCRPPHPHGQQQGLLEDGTSGRRYSPGERVALVLCTLPTPHTAPKSNPFLLVMYWDCNHRHLLLPPKPYTYHHRAAPRSGNVPAGGLHVRHDDLPAPPPEVQRPCRMAPQRPSQQQHLEKSSRQRGQHGVSASCVQASTHGPDPRQEATRRSQRPRQPLPRHGGPPPEQL